MFPMPYLKIGFIMVNTITESTLIATLTVGDLRQLFREFQSEKIKEVVRPHGRTGHGLHSIECEFGVSHKTAQAYKDGILAPAVSQRGRKIVVDLDYARELFNESKGK